MHTDGNVPKQRGMLLRNILKARWSVRVFSHGTSSADEGLTGPSMGRQVSVDACRFFIAGWADQAVWPSTLSKTCAQMRSSWAPHWAMAASNVSGASMESEISGIQQGGPNNG